jgi:tRNA modification GTPase
MAALGRADAVVLVKDGSIAETRGDRQAEEEAARAAAGARIIRVLNKSDLPLIKSRRRAGCLNVSARTGAGIALLKGELTERGKKALREGAQAVVTSARHFAALSASSGELRALDALLAKPRPPAELAAEHLRGALNALSSILGETTTEEVLADIFGNFCVGK